MYRFEIINSFIKKHNFKNYLEIGVCHGDCIREVQCENKDGVDSGWEGHMVPETNFKMTSDAFFQQNEKIYDIVFIDGLHHSDQVDKDIINSINYTTDNGVIILHDCNPPTYAHSVIPCPNYQMAWNGDVYKSVLRFQQNNQNHTFFTVDSDWGVGVILKNTKPTHTLTPEQYQRGIDDWFYFDKNRKELLNLMSIQSFKEIHQ